MGHLSRFWHMVAYVFFLNTQNSNFISSHIDTVWCLTNIHSTLSSPAQAWSCLDSGVPRPGSTVIGWILSQSWPSIFPLPETGLVLANDLDLDYKM